MNDWQNMLAFRVFMEWSLVTAVVVRATILLALAAAAALLARRASASWRHLLWTLGLGCVLCLPLLMEHLPRWRMQITVPPTHVRQITDEAPPAAPNLAPAGLASAAASSQTVGRAAIRPVENLAPQAASAPAARAVSAMPPRFPLHFKIPAALTAMLLGSIFVLARAARGLLAVRRVARDCVPVADGPLADAAQAAAMALGLRRPVNLRLASASSPVTVPLTYGAARPVIVLPADAEAWPADRLRAALLHEMAHVRRGDWTLLMLAHLAAALYWFHPLLWLAVARMRAEAEAACDDLVLGAGLPAPDYARHLLDVALSARDHRRLRLGAVAMARGPQVEGRLHTILATGRNRRALTGRATSAVAAAALLLVLPVAALTLMRQGPPVPAADHLQLHGPFTLRYAVTVTDLSSHAADHQEYEQLRSDYAALLKTNPYYQPVPAEYYAPFSYFELRQPRTQHKMITVSSNGHELLWRSQAEDQTYALLYNGRNGTQLFNNGQAGSIAHGDTIDPGLPFTDMADCPLPALGLPDMPLFQGTTLLNASGSQQTWQANFPLPGYEWTGHPPPVIPLIAQAVNVGGTWKVLDIDSSSEQWQFPQHQKFEGFWLATRITETVYQIADAQPFAFTTLPAMIQWSETHRTPTEVGDYRLLSASTSPLDFSSAGMRLVSAAPPKPRNAPAFWGQDLEDYDVQEALHLRFHLQPWAQAHLTLLRRMADGPADMQAATNAQVAQSLNHLPLPLYPGDPRPLHYWDGDPRVGHDGQKSAFLSLLPALTGDSNAHDFPIAQSRGSGKTHVILWASGRITRTAPGPGGSAQSEEIVPPFTAAGGMAG